MKATEITQSGYYWCSHDLNWSQLGDEAQRQWTILEFVSPREIWPIMADESLKASEIPENVEFIGPLTSP